MVAPSEFSDGEPVLATAVDLPPQHASGTVSSSGALSSLDPGGEFDSSIAAETLDSVAVGPRPSILRRSFRFVGRQLGRMFCLGSLIVSLAVLAAIPVLQLITFGYLLDVAGRLTRGGKLADSLPSFRSAGKIGLAAVGLFVASLPTQLLAHLETVASDVNPGSAASGWLRGAAIASSLLATMLLVWVWMRGGTIWNHLWPQPIRFCKEIFRPRTWNDAVNRLWDFTVSLELPRLFWLGLRGMLGTLVWLIPAGIVILANRRGETGLAGLIGVIAVGTTGIVLLYLPMLQAHFAAENRIAALFQLRTIRQDFRRAPWAWFAAMFVGLVLTPIPLYLLKIEATPREVVWAPCLVFVAFILPARIAAGLALRRARRLPEPTGGWAVCSRWTVRILMLAVVGTYLVFLTISQYTSWDGLETWIQQHAILVPVPFKVGV